MRLQTVDKISRKDAREALSVDAQIRAIYMAEKRRKGKDQVGKTVRVVR